VSATRGSSLIIRRIAEARERMAPLDDVRPEASAWMAPLDDVRPVPAFALGRLPRIHFGPGQFEEIPAIAARHGRRVLLVAGARSLRASGRLERLREAMANAGLEVSGEVSVEGEPSPSLVDGAVASWRDAGVDVVVACGGGSALDAGKAIAGLLRTGTSVLDHLEVVGRGLPYPGPAVPVVAVPTTAGTGSEATRNAVLSAPGAEGFKRSFRDERLVPADAVVDPDLLAGAPPGLIAGNGMDAVTQLLEAWVSTGASPVTDALALDGLAHAGSALLDWHADPDGPAAPGARSRMAYAALLSGICLANAGLGAVHGLASPLGALLPIPHGIACGVLLAPVVAVTVAALTERSPGSPALARYASVGRVLTGLPEAASDEWACEALVEQLRMWAGLMRLPGLGAFGLTAVDIPGIVTASRAGSMRTHPIELTGSELEAVLRTSL
jgi:alcohol dehydrogenase class IV